MKRYALKRRANESYLAAAMRYAARAPLVTERKLRTMATRDSYLDNLGEGMDPCDAALYACFEVGCVTKQDVECRPRLREMLVHWIRRKVWR